jgi:hypothetical protein
VHRTDRVRQILATRGLTLYQVSQRSAEIFGRSSPYYVPHNLYYSLDDPLLCPRIEQFVAVSQISNYRLCDWLAVFGFHLDQIAHVQPLLTHTRTVFLDSTLYDENAWIPWFSQKIRDDAVPSIAPLSLLLSPTMPKRAKELADFRRREFLYAKVGGHDLLAFPELLPGSVIRIDTRRAQLPLDRTTVPTGQIYLIEQNSRLFCGRLQWTGKDRLILCSTQFPFAQLELGPASAAQVHGVVDAEMRPLTRRPVDSTEWGSALAPSIAVVRPTAGAHSGLKYLLPSLRLQAGLTFREASRLSRTIAQVLGDEQYFSAPGTLSDYETLAHLPRHVQKVISLCILYRIPFWEFLRAAGLPIESCAGDPIPDELVPRPVPQTDQFPSKAQREHGGEHSGFLQTVIERWGEIPLFARHSLAVVSGLKHLSMSDVFWVGGDPNPIHPYLANASLAVINRRMKKPGRSAAQMLWEQPLYVILKRGGNFLCGVCTLHKDLLVVHPYPERSFAPRKLRNELDAEVIGQVTAIVRHLP